MEEEKEEEEEEEEEEMKTPADVERGWTGRTCIKAYLLVAVPCQALGGLEG